MVTTFTNGGNIRVEIKKIGDLTPILKNKHEPKPLEDKEVRTADEKYCRTKGSIC